MFDGIDPWKEPWVHFPSPRRAIRRAIGAVLADTVRTAWMRRRTRRAIARLDPFLLKDIGVSYAEAEAEANKPFWMR